MAPVESPEQEDSDEPKIYEVTEDDNIEENDAPDAPEPEVPQVRQQQEVKMGFTEKKFAHLPARESQLKEPPYPKSKNHNPNKKDKDVYIDVEDKDPVWLKDKGDHFFKRYDYNAAL